MDGSFLQTSESVVPRTNRLRVTPSTEKSRKIKVQKMGQNARERLQIWFVHFAFSVIVILLELENRFECDVIMSCIIGNY